MKTFYIKTQTPARSTFEIEAEELAILGNVVVFYIDKREVMRITQNANPARWHSIMDHHETVERDSEQARKWFEKEQSQ